MNIHITNQILIVLSIAFKQSDSSSLSKERTTLTFLGGNLPLFRTLTGTTFMNYHVSVGLQIYLELFFHCGYAVDRRFLAG